MIKIVLLGVITAIIGIQFKDHNEYGIYLGIVGCIIISLYVLKKVGVVIDTIDQLKRYIYLDVAYIEILIKIIGITYVAEFASQICDDAGYGGISKQIEVGGKFTILAISMPVLVNLLNIVSNILH